MFRRHSASTGGALLLWAGLSGCGSQGAGPRPVGEAGPSASSDAGVSGADASAAAGDVSGAAIDGATMKQADAWSMEGGRVDGSSLVVDGSGSAQADGGIVPGGVRWVGRVDGTDPNAVKFAWSGTGFVAVVSGAKISALLETEGTSSAFFQPVIDGVVGARFQVMSGSQQTVVLGSGLSATDHTVELYRESEGMYGDSVFAGFADGTLKGAPPSSGRLIEVVGDSISAGYGNLGMEVHPPWDNTCTFSLDTESAYEAYGSMIGRALNAEVSIIARSGWGMYRDNGGSTSGVLSSVYGNTLGTQSTPQWDFKRQADAVVIDLGTNDVGEPDGGQGDPGTPYEDAYVAFLHTLRSHYANAWVFLTIGPMTSDPLLSDLRAHIANVVIQVGDAKVTAVDLATQDSTMTGCDYHPNVAEDTVMAGVLTTAIKAKLGW
jgi:lysophospholipase L1-like esterase